MPARSQTFGTILEQNALVVNTGSDPVRHRARPLAPVWPDDRKTAVEPEGRGDRSFVMTPAIIATNDMKNTYKPDSGAVSV
jgi:hypothetical protein